MTSVASLSIAPAISYDGLRGVAASPSRGLRMQALLVQALERAVHEPVEAQQKLLYFLVSWGQRSLPGKWVCPFKRCSLTFGNGHMDSSRDPALTAAAIRPPIPRRRSMIWIRTRAVFVLFFTMLLSTSVVHADGVSVVKECESNTSSPEDTQKLSILPNGETRGSDTAATLIKMARQKAKEGKDTEAIQWAALCQFEEAQQAAIKRDSGAVLQYLRQ
jgi:hypothetical protein